MLARRHRWSLALALPLLFAASAARAQHITSPREQFGHNIGDDYWLANYDQLQEYWKKLDAESDRMQVVSIGQTAEGRPQLMSIISSPANLAKLERYKSIAQRLAHAEGLTDDEARALAKEGKAVVWIDGGLHATEVLGAAQLMETVYQLVSRTDDETKRILDDVIILAVHANPDGMQLVSNWYMQEADSLKRNMNIPRLYQKYIGHDDNRDFYMSNQVETQNLNHVMFWDWFPQIVYNHHQTGPAGAVMFAPPFRDPFNYNIDPLIVLGIDRVGAAMNSRMVEENKPGVITRSGTSYSTWWNGGLRTVGYFHNMIGLLTETIGNPTPQRIPFITEQMLPRADYVYPVAPQLWHFRQSVDYSITANWAVLDLASRNRDQLLYDIYRMGRNSIERGSRDNWTISGSKLAAVNAAAAQQRATAEASGTAPATRGGRGNGAATVGATGAPVDTKLYADVLHAAAARDARAYVIPSDQPDFLTATKFVNTLRHVGITVQRATGPVSAGGKTYPAGSFVVPAAQAFRPHVLDMFEPQDHPNDFAYPGGPPKRPYDNAGYTLAYQMGVKFDRILDGPVTGTLVAVEGLAKPEPGSISGPKGNGYVLAPTNDAFRAVNRLLKEGAQVSRFMSATKLGALPVAAGSFWIATPITVRASLQMSRSARDLGVSFVGAPAKPGSALRKLTLPRIALWDQYGGSMPSGHTRWLLEQFEFPFDVIYPNTLDSLDLHAKYDAIVFVDGAIPAADNAGGGFGGGGGRNAVIRPEFQYMAGRVTVAKTVPQLRKFLEAGGTVLTIGSSTNLAYDLGVPITSALVDDAGKALVADKFYVPGSVLSVAVDNTDPLALGLEQRVDVFYDNSPVFRLGADAAQKGVRAVAWFNSPTPLRSGWAWGQAYLDKGVAIAEANVGAGKLLLFGPEILFRGQPHGTFRFFFNGLYDR
ncbi:MAG: peptidase carboxypeptidase [Gemmatimonadetes bacterium]|nr:peptidase carboxypeptidase [Gemmatimonadota bacterium]